MRWFFLLKKTTDVPFHQDTYCGTSIWELSWMNLFIKILMERNKESLSNIIATAKKPFRRGWLFVPELKLMKFPRLFNGALSREVSRSSSIVSIPGIIKGIYVTGGSKSCRNLIPQPHGIRGLLIKVATFHAFLEPMELSLLSLLFPIFNSHCFFYFGNLFSFPKYDRFKIEVIWYLDNS